MMIRERRVEPCGGARVGLQYCETGQIAPGVAQ
jgi:hypothetical protein